MTAHALHRPGDLVADTARPKQARARVRGRHRTEPRLVCMGAASREHEPDPQPAHAERAAEAPGERSALAGLRVLVVEDEALVALEIEDLLAELGAEVVGTALDADEAVRLAGALRPDCITMDIRIQGDRDGIAAATEIWALYGIRSLLVSAHGEALTLARASPANPIGLVPKPISKARLAAALEAFRA